MASLWERSSLGLLCRAFSYWVTASAMWPCLAMLSPSLRQIWAVSDAGSGLTASAALAEGAGGVGVVIAWGRVTHPSCGARSRPPARQTYHRRFIVNLDSDNKSRLRLSES